MVAFMALTAARWGRFGLHGFQDRQGAVGWTRSARQTRAERIAAVSRGRLYYRTEKGTMLLIEPSAKEYVERGRFEQPDRSKEPAWPHPIIANGKLYLRDQGTMFCDDVKAK